MMPDLSTPEGRKAWNDSLKAAAEKMRRDTEAFKAANGGKSVTQLMRRKDTRFNNSGLNGWA